MAKYTSDTKLIQGAATAYKNYDNVAGMYSGLDKVTKAGTDMIGEAVKQNKAEQEKIKKEQEKAKKEQEREASSRKQFNILSENVLKKFNGSPKTTIYQDEVRKKLDLLKADLFKANKTNDKNLMNAVNAGFSNILQDVASYKESRANLADISNAVTGENLEILTAWGKEEKTVEQENGEEVFVIDVGDKEVRKTLAELNAMMIPQDTTPQDNFTKIFRQYDKVSKKPNDALLMYDIQQTVIPQTPDGLHAYLSDPVFGMKKLTFSQQMLAPNNREGFTAHLKSEGVELSDYDTNSDATDDYEEFVDAIANPNNKFWKGDKEAWHKKSSVITAEILANLTKNTLGVKEEEEEEVDFDDIIIEG